MKLLLASVATIGLLLAGPQKASAQVLNACVTFNRQHLHLGGAELPLPRWDEDHFEYNTGGCRRERVRLWHAIRCS